MRKGFTLVELAIVLVIIGLLVGGVLAGQELIKQAQIRSVLRSLNEFDTATATFRAKYGELPGDFRRASAVGINANTAQTMGAGNGNGNGDKSLTFYDTVALEAEVANFWVHLSNAQLIKGSFSQVTNCMASNGDCNGAAGTAFPALPVGTGAIAWAPEGRLYYIVGVTASLNDGSGDPINVEGDDYSAIGDTLTQEDAYSIDGKIDDGVPTTGIAWVAGTMGGPGWRLQLDTAGASDCYSSGNYNLSLNTKTCTLAIRASN